VIFAFVDVFAFTSIWVQFVAFVALALEFSG